MYVASNFSALVYNVHFIGSSLSVARKIKNKVTHFKGIDDTEIVCIHVFSSILKVYIICLEVRKKKKKKWNKIQ